MEYILNKIFKLAKDFLFPIFCLSCKAEGEWVCVNCRDGILLPGIFSDKDLYLDSHIAIFSYQENDVIGKLIKVYKYNFAEDIKNIWSEYINEFFGAGAVEYFSTIDMVVPVPLHPRRFAERGFNQAEQIAECLGAYIGKPVTNCLKRVRYTEKQAGLGREDRLKNVSDAFAMFKNVDSIKNKTVLLVDDVYTTGTTMQECARVLLESGAVGVSGFTLARA